ncbi:cytochrome b [Roseobacter sinensis]|uniref:Cytochrome b n=1 Tax=Roseobacter sinensis TaxID=2931391 RepID=A0ABT3BHN2_9RHOB|nr:cytochrome b [Roseobacter sp. WL0113]MCV3273082.1 cytochrome b [Roseobacter sp. WL0113]
MRYDRISRLNHWIVAVAMIGMLLFGLYLAYGGLEREARRPLIGLHRSIGILVLIYGAWRVTWRVVRGFPDSVSDMPRWQRRLSTGVHWSLLAGILIMPLSGIGFTIFRGRDLDVFGWVAIPAAAEVPWIVSLSSGLHHYVGLGLCALVVLHVAAALKHHLWDKDETLTRMIWGRAPADEHRSAAAQMPIDEG